MGDSEIFVGQDDRGMDRALKRLKKSFEGGIYRDYRRHEFFVSPSERARQKTFQAIKRAKKSAMRALEGQYRREDRCTRYQNHFKGMEKRKGGVS